MPAPGTSSERPCSYPGRNIRGGSNTAGAACGPRDCVAPTRRENLAAARRVEEMTTVARRVEEWIAATRRVEELNTAARRVEELMMLLMDSVKCKLKISGAFACESEVCWSCFVH